MTNPILSKLDAITCPWPVQGSAMSDTTMLRRGWHAAMDAVRAALVDAGDEKDRRIADLEAEVARLKGEPDHGVRLAGVGAGSCDCSQPANVDAFGEKMCWECYGEIEGVCGHLPSLAELRAKEGAK